MQAKPEMRNIERNTELKIELKIEPSKHCRNCAKNGAKNRDSANQRGASMVEYLLVVVLVAIVSVAGAKVVGEKTKVVFLDTRDALQGAGGFEIPGGDGGGLEGF